MTGHRTKRPPPRQGLPSPKEWRDLLPLLTEQERDELDALLLAPVPWAPFPGPQSRALKSKADIVGYGGAAGGGKTDLLLGCAHTQHWKSIIFRREYTQLEDIVIRGQDLFKPPMARFRGAPRYRWRFEDGRTLELGGVEQEKDLTKWQGRPHDFIGVDEATHFSEYMFRFLAAWLRTTRMGQRCRLIATFNPPMSAEGDWVNEFWGPWLDRRHPRPAKDGELRWYAMIDGVDTEVVDGTPFWHNNELIQPLSRTFFHAKVEDNPFLMATGYRAQLQALPEPMRSIMLRGAFDATQADHPWQVIPTAWIEAAQARWTPKTNGTRGALSAVGIDVARGGKDKSVYTPRYGNWFAEQTTKPGRATPDGQAVVRDAIEILGDERVPLNIDVGGVGTSPVDIAKMFQIEVVPLNGANASGGVDKATKKLRFFNMRAEWHWRLREALDPQSGQDLAIPPDPQLRADLAAPRYEYTARGIKIEDKDEIKERIKRSPDKGESLIYAHAQPTSVQAVIASPILFSAGPIAMPHNPQYGSAFSGRG